NSSFRAPTQSSSQVPSTLTLRLLRRCLSNCSSDSFSQAYFRRGIGSRSDKKRYQMVSQDAVGNNRQVFAACPCSVTRVGYGSSLCENAQTLNRDRRSYRPRPF